MTVTAVVLLTVTALVPFAATGYRRITGSPADPSTLDIAAALVLAVLAILAALFALPTATASDVVLVITRIVSTVAAVTCGGTLVRAALFAGGVGRTGTDRQPGSDPDTPDPADDGPLRGGHLIGYLERLAVIGSLHAGWPAGLPVVLAVKGLARYPELRSAQVSEQFIVGTFVSVLWAAGVFGIAQLILT